MDGWPDSFGGDFAVEHELHVTGAFELLENDFIHAAAGVDQGCSDDGQASAFLEVSGSAEKLARNVEGAGCDAAGKGFSGRVGVGIVVGTCQARDGIEQNQDVFAFEHARDCVDKDLFGDANMVFGRLVGGGSDDFEGHVACKVGGFLGAFVDEQRYLIDVGIVGSDGLADGLQDGGFTGLGRTRNQTALSTRDWRE